MKRLVFAEVALAVFALGWTFLPPVDPVVGVACAVVFLFLALNDIRTNRF